MGAPAALSGTDLTNLNARKTVLNLYLSIDPMTEKATATVASFPSTTPFVTISTAGESAGWTTAVRKDMLAIISDGSTGKPKAYLRVRDVPIAGTLYVEEVDYGDNGLFTIQYRPSPIIGGDTISIRETYPPFAVKPYTDPDGTEFQDYNIAVANRNRYPDSVYNVTINSRPGDYFKMVANGGTQVIVATITPTAWPQNTGATYTYSWSYPASFTGVSGAATATLTATAPVGAHWIYCDVTDSVAGTMMTIKRFIRIHSPADPPLAIKILSSPSAQQDRTGWTLRFTLVNARAMTIPKGTAAWIWDDATFNGSDITTAAHVIAGFINSAPYEHRAMFDEEVLELIGVAGALDKLSGHPAAWNYTGELSTWSQLPSTLQGVPFVMWWILRWRTANVLTRFNFTPFSYSSGLGNRKNLQVGEGSILSQLKALASSYFGNVGTRADGEIMCVLNPSLRVDRSGMITRATLDNSMYKVVKAVWKQRPDVGLFTLRGFLAADDWSPDGAQVASAPGRQASSNASGSRNETDHIFDDTTQAGIITGHCLSYANNPFQITIEFADYWPVFECCDMQRWPITIPANRSPSGADTTITCIPVSGGHNYLGQRAQTTMVLESETEGTPGVVFSEVTGASNMAEYGDFSLTPTPPVVPATWGPTNTVTPIKTDGSDVAKGAIIATSDGYVIKNGNSNISPTSAQRAALGTVIKLIQDPFDYKRLLLFGSQGCLICDNHTAANPRWRTVTLNTSAASTTTASKTVPANLDDPGYNTGVAVSTGDRLVITATGTWSGFGGTSGPDGSGGACGSCTLTSAPAGALIGRIGTSGSWFLVGSNYSATAGATGTLYLTVNDSPGAYGNNTGSMSATIQLTPAAAVGVTYFGDIQGSINRKGYLCWLGQDGTNVYFYYTANYFQTRKRVLIAAYHANKVYTIGVGSYGNSTTRGVIFVTADTSVYRSTNYGQTFSDLAIAVNASGGPLVVPFAKNGGTPNAGTSPQYLLVKGISTNLQAQSLAGSTVTLAAGSSHVPIGPYSLNVYKQDGAYCWCIMSDGTFWTSVDGGGTWTQQATPAHTGSVYGATGSPKNLAFALAFGNECLAFSANSGASWTSIHSAYRTWADANIGSGKAQTIVTALIDLNALYSKSVTQ